MSDDAWTLYSVRAERAAIGNIAATDLVEIARIERKVGDTGDEWIASNSPNCSCDSASSGIAEALDTVLQ